jgi:hypothetical protein
MARPPLPKCPACGKAVRPGPRPGPPKTYCSVGCRRTAQGRRLFRAPCDVEAILAGLPPPPPSCGPACYAVVYAGRGLAGDVLPVLSGEYADEAAALAGAAELARGRPGVSVWRWTDAGSSGGVMRQALVAEWPDGPAAQGRAAGATREVRPVRGDRRVPA